MTRLSGRVPETGTAIQGVTVAIIDTQGVEDPTQWSVVASDTTDANGEWSVSGLDPSAVERYHAVAQYDDGSAFTNFESLPYLSTPADAFAPTTSLSVGTPTADVSVGSVIPDSGVYLHDDWEDDQIFSNRVDSGQTTTNGVTGYYRPEWTDVQGDNTVSNGVLDIGTRGDNGVDSQIVSTTLNLDTSSFIRWEIIARGTNIESTAGYFQPDIWWEDGNNYWRVRIDINGNEGNEEFVLDKFENGSQTVVINSTYSADTNFKKFEVERSAAGDWEIFIDGATKGTTTDTFAPAVNNFRVHNRQDRNVEVDEIKVDSD